LIVTEEESLVPTSVCEKHLQDKGKDLAFVDRVGFLIEYAG
jgi:hypothetical protein